LAIRAIQPHYPALQTHLQGLSHLFSSGCPFFSPAFLGFPGGIDPLPLRFVIVFRAFSIHQPHFGVPFGVFSCPPTSFTPNWENEVGEKIKINPKMEGKM
jgi:hypothetical protein